MVGGTGAQENNYTMTEKKMIHLVGYVYRGISNVSPQIIFKVSSNSPNLDVNHL